MSNHEIVALKPIEQSYDINDADAAVKRVFMGLIEQLIREDERRINVYAVPHLGDFYLQSRFIKQDGFAVINRDDKSLYYLFKAWRYRNRMRGLHLLRAYLQVLWENSWSVDQMWQKKSAPYPTDLVVYDKTKLAPNDYYLTSRVRVGIDDVTEMGAGIHKFLPSIRTTLAAKYVLDVYLKRLFQNTARAGGIKIAQCCTFDSYISLSGVVEITEFNGGEVNNLAVKNALSMGGYVGLEGVAS